MTWFQQTNGTWSETLAPPEEGPSIEVRASESEVPEVRFLNHGQTFFDVSGVTPGPTTDTTHTVATVDPESAWGALVFAVHASGNDLVFEDRRDDADATVSDGALEHVQSALNEILVPVYIDDVVSDLSERASGLAVVHTLQTGDDEEVWSYFRTSIFRDGSLALEAERGTLSA